MSCSSVCFHFPIGDVFHFVHSPTPYHTRCSPAAAAGAVQPCFCFSAFSFIPSYSNEFQKKKRVLETIMTIHNSVPISPAHSKRQEQCSSACSRTSAVRRRWTKIKGMAKETCLLATCSGERHVILTVRCLMSIDRDFLTGDGSAAVTPPLLQRMRTLNVRVKL